VLFLYFVPDTTRDTEITLKYLTENIIDRFYASITWYFQKSIFFINSLNNTDLFMSFESLYIKTVKNLNFFLKNTVVHDFY
jgi:hypothetical protein